ncbi:uncharacterized protein LOC127003111 [Eriocheir sinensis]|uniref:uncharacterized protein LOC127003111 n=1 Tax=Eriocheir sinensis TaxID=95602 RepID=UPI0021C68419|nr:uncharacterized protein LOC127003111 [Eriocheir sinensis]
MLFLTIRKADKAATYVIMETSEYLQKIDDILNETTKFKRITRDPTEDLKKKVNKLIVKNNIASRSIKLEKLSGEFSMGYCYGNVKTHKPGNKLRPIISQIPTPTYNLAKQLCTLLTPYVPSTHNLQASSDFLDILKTSNTRGRVASLDVESLFTNVPVDRTINYIIERPSYEISWKEAPFTCPRGNKYCQIDGVAMGSPLGVLLANFFMGCVEEEVFKKLDKPDIYCRYIDDIFIKTENDDDAERLRLCLQEVSGLKLTIEKSVNNSIPFLDILAEDLQALPSMRRQTGSHQSSMRAHEGRGTSQSASRPEESSSEAPA